MSATTIQETTRIEKHVGNGDATAIPPEHHGELTTDLIEVTSLGSGLHMVSDTKREFNWSLCEEILNLAELKGDNWTIERSLRNDHVNLLIKAMQRGTFHTEWVRLITCECAEDGVTYRMNGQHTSWARLNFPEDWHKSLPISKVSVTKYSAATFPDMRQLYASIDRGASRTRSNVLMAYTSGLEQFEGIPPTLLKSMAEGVAFWKKDHQDEKTGNKYKRLDGDEVAFLMQVTHKDVVNAVGAFCASSPSILTLPWMKRAPVVAAMYETFGKSAKAAVEFWDGVRTGVSLGENDPRLELRNALMSCNISSHDVHGGRKKKSVNRETMYHWAVHSFNHFRKGQPLKSMKALLSAGRPKAK